MPDTTDRPAAMLVPLAALVQVAIETWRLGTWLAAQSASAPTSGAARHAHRKLEDFCRQQELEAVSLDGKPYDPGMAARVLDTINDPAIPRGKTVIGQTVSPLVLWRGNVIQPAEIIAHQGS